VRFHRITGEAEVFYRNGWGKLKKDPDKIETIGTDTNGASLRIICMKTQVIILAKSEQLLCGNSWRHRSRHQSASRSLEGSEA
jgi:hypothetical protein